MIDFDPETSGEGPATNGASQGCFVVCVDDDPEFVRSLELFLPKRIKEAATSGPAPRFLFFTDPRDALDSLSEIVSPQEPLAMVISDQQMPQMKGTAFLARIREQYPDCVRVLLTGHAGLDSAITAINEQLLDKYLTKPVDNEHDFTVSIRLLLQRFWMQRTIAAQGRMLGDLYAFSNALNALTSLGSTVNQVTDFARSALASRHASVWLIEGGEVVLASRASEQDPVLRGRLDPQAAGKVAGTHMTRIETVEAAAWLRGLRDSSLVGLPPCPFLQATLYAGRESLGILAVGDRATRLPYDARDERILGYIADTASIAIFNRLQSAELEKAYNSSQAHAVALAAANERLCILDKLKDDFLNFVSHELRTPLTVLAGIEYLDPPPDRPDQAELSAALRGGYERLRRFIETALDYGTWIAGERIRDFESVDFADVVSAAVKETRSLTERAADVHVSVPHLPCVVRGSRSDLTEVVGTLLANATKFCPMGKRIRISCDVFEGKAELVVVDEGVGFAPELAEELLKPFTIADSLHHASGSALHLAKAAAIVIAHGGELRASSAGAGLGATFTVRIPLVTPDPSATDAAPVAGARIDATKTRG
jgi:signal transduction histidine kinase/FixJ family two-component response regulator